MRDLRRAAMLLGVETALLDFRSLTARAGGEGREPFAHDAILVRSMPAGTLEQVIFRMDVLQRLEADGVRVVNAPRPLESAIDKYLCTVRMEAAGLPVPETFVCEKAVDALGAFEALGGAVVVKPLFGSEGRGVMRLEGTRDAEARFRELEAAGSVIYLQRLVEHPGHDFRIFTLGERVLCGMRRVTAGGWITNVAQGARAEPLEVTPELESLALAAARSIGAQVAGVDLLPDRDGRLWVLEVNAVPGWRALSQTSGVDVAQEVVRYLSK